MPESGRTAWLEAKGGGARMIEAGCDMERWYALEAKLDAVRVDLAELNRKVSRLPTVWTMGFINLGLAVTVPGLVFAIAWAMR
jgi:hypothetical protein